MASIDSFPVESSYYLVGAGFVQLLGAFVISLFFFPIAHRLTNNPFPRIFRAYLVFNAFLLFWGCLGNYVFLLLTYGKLYVSGDDIVVEWLPFIPFGQWVLDQGGYLLGTATLWQLRLIWFAVAAPVWLLTYAFTVFALRLRFPRKA